MLFHKKFSHLIKPSNDKNLVEINLLFLSYFNPIIFHLDIPSESNAKIYAGKLASDASTQYILIKSDTVQNNTPTNLSRISSSTPQSLSRQSTGDFCANNMMNRDPVVGFTQRRSITNDHESLPVKEQEIKIDTQLERKELVAEINLIEENDEERMMLELAIKKSLEDQQESIVEIDNDIINTIESSSDSDGKSNK
jgi:hypothetical protein